MSNTTNLTIRIDTELKKEAEELFEDLGLNMTTAIKMFLKTCIEEQAYPYPISKSKVTMKGLLSYIEDKQIKKHPEKYKKYDSAEEMIADILSEDIE